MSPRNLAALGALAVARGLRVGASVAGFAAAGALNRDELEHAVSTQWERYGRCSWSPDTGLLPWEAAFYLERLRPGDHVLLVGSGSGRDLFPLLAHGCTVTGLDIARDAVEACRRGLAARGLQARLRVGSVVDAPLDGPYDAVILSWFCYSYVRGRAQRVAALRRIREALRPEGCVLISYIRRPERLSRWPPRVATLVATLLRSGWRAEYGDRIAVSGAWRAPAVEYQHDFAPEEVVAEAHAAGLRVDAHEVGDDGRVVLVPASPASPASDPLASRPAPR